MAPYARVAHLMTLAESLVRLEEWCGDPVLAGFRSAHLDELDLELDQAENITLQIESIASAAARGVQAWTGQWLLAIPLLDEPTPVKGSWSALVKRLCDFEPPTIYVAGPGILELPEEAMRELRRTIESPVTATLGMVRSWKEIPSDPWSSCLYLGSVDLNS